SLVDTTQNRLVWGTQKDALEEDLPLLASSMAREAVTALGSDLPKLYDYIENLAGDAAMNAMADTSEAIGALRRDDLPTALSATERLVEAFPGALNPRALRTYALLLRWEQDLQAQHRLPFEESLDLLDRIDPGNPYSQIFRAYV